MHANRTKRRNRTELLAVTAVVCLVLVSPFVLVSDSVAILAVQGNSAQAFNFHAGLDQLAKSVGMPTGESSRELPEIIGMTIYAALSLVGVIFLILIILAGLRWMTAGASEEIIHQAKGSILHSAVGMAIILGAYALTYFVFKYIF